jgi:NADH:ubiquinone oxidoreductase subunit 3 (subunit A)
LLGFDKTSFKVTPVRINFVMIVIIFHLFDQEFKFIALWVSRFIQAISLHV